EGKKEGDSFTFVLPATEYLYDVDLFFTKGPDYGNVAVRHGGRNVCTFKGYDRSVGPGGKISLPDIPATGGEIPLQFVVEGKDPRSTGYAVGLDAFAMRPHREFVPEWSLTGPFPNPRDSSLNRLGLDIVYPPEREIDIAQTYTGAGGQKIGWWRAKTPKSGSVEFDMLDPHDLVVAYAFTYVYSPERQTLPLLLGSDDGVKVFLNGDEVYRLLTIRGAEPDQDNVSLHLKKGWNRLLLKIENNFGGYNFYARIPDPARTLKFNAARAE
ncbi:MAG TPA: hypothetical protein VF514_09645, partial [Bacteroidota bacterium]